MPKRPLSAYNLFFRDQRNALVADAEEEDAADDDEASVSGATNMAESGGKRKHRKSHGKVGFVSII